MNGIHQEEREKKKKNHHKKWIEKVKLWKLEQNAFAAYELSAMRYSMLEKDPISPSPSLDVRLLCEDMFTTIESTVTGKTTLWNEIPTDAIVFVLSPLSSFLSFSFPLVQSLV